MNTVSLKNAPIQNVFISREKTAMPKQNIKTLFNALEPGDIFRLENTPAFTSVDDGMYIVRQRDDENNGILLTKLNSNKDAIPVENMGNILYTDRNLEGSAEIVGSLNVTA